MHFARSIILFVFILGLYSKASAQNAAPQNPRAKEISVFGFHITKLSQSPDYPLPEPNPSVSSELKPTPLLGIEFKDNKARLIAKATGLLYIGATEKVSVRAWIETADGRESSFRTAMIEDQASAMIPIMEGQAFVVERKDGKKGKGKNAAPNVFIIVISK